jgi:hypothetical protein
MEKWLQLPIDLEAALKNMLLLSCIQAQPITHTDSLTGCCLGLLSLHRALAPCSLLRINVEGCQDEVQITARGDSLQEAEARSRQEKLILHTA